MDERTEQLWRRGSAPFDGLTLWTAPLSGAHLRTAIRAIVTMLESYIERPQLRTTEDWHEHDGYQAPGQDASWAQLVAALASDAALRASTPDDDDVRRAWLALDGSFYLRWCWSDDERSPDDPAQAGDTDLTASRTIIESVAGRLTELDIDVEIEPAGAFFADRCGG